MAVYQIEINERMAFGKSLVEFLRSMPQVVALVKQEKKPKPKGELYESLNSAFADVRLMLDGKKKEKTLDELINEL